MCFSISLIYNTDSSSYRGQNTATALYGQQQLAEVQFSFHSTPVPYRFFLIKKKIEKRKTVFKYFSYLGWVI